MTKDNLIFAVFGILLGFIAGYLLHEVMAARQPARLTAGAVVQGMPQQGVPPGNAGGAGAPSGPGPAMEQVQQLSRRVQENPNDADAVLQLANMNFEIGQWARARDLYSQYLTLRPENPDVLSDIGVTYREQGQFDQALDMFRRAHALDSSHWRSLFNQVVILGIDLERYDEAEEALQKLRQLQPGNSDVERLATEVEQRRSQRS
ncbi:MAG TPA: tetratricopeptide repeat protein [Thermoanaerobaculia bacterium]|nr:tetratricopeptide repeat protein [Thermoanaerobaculia bacterium]